MQESQEMPKKQEIQAVAKESAANSQFLQVPGHESKLPLWSR